MCHQTCFLARSNKQSLSDQYKKVTKRVISPEIAKLNNYSQNTNIWYLFNYFG